jgi:hypothetical protein
VHTVSRSVPKDKNRAYDGLQENISLQVTFIKKLHKPVGNTKTGLEGTMQTEA